MAVGYNPRAVTDGLVLALDAGNPKNYNVGISTNWTDKIGGNNGTLVGGTHHNDGPFVGAGYVEFDGDSDSLTATASTDFTLDGEFTVEFWIYLNTIVLDSQHPSPITFSQSGGNKGQIYLNASNNYFSLWNGSSNVVNTGNNSVTTGRWYHVAVTRDSSDDCRIFLDGVLKDTASSTVTFGNASGDLRIGSFNGTGGDVNGNISNLRIVKGTALYTSNFTPPTGPLTAVTNTVLLTCQGNTIADASSSGHTITANGDISLTKEPFAGAGAVKFDGSGDRLSASSSDFSLDGDFTVEYWIQSQNNTGNSGYVLHFGGGNTSYFGTKSGSYVLQANNNGEHFWTGVPTINTWVHLALVRSGSTVTLYEDGISLGNKTESQIFGNSTFVIADWDGQFPVTGYISNFRIIKGTALYTSNFTPPSRTLEPIENTVLLTCQGQNIKDYSSSAHTITSNGNAKPTIVSSSFEFDGTDDYIDLTQTIQFDTSDFSISGWFRSNSGNTSYKQIWSSGYNGGTPDVEIVVNQTNNQLRFYVRPPSPGLTATTTYSVDDNVWRHFTATKTSSEISLYVNGSLVDSTSGSLTSDVDTAGVIPRIGNGLSGTNNRPFKGNISQIAVYNRALTASEVQQNYNATKGRYA